MKKAALVLWVLSGALWCSGCSLVLWVLSGALGALVSLVLSGCSLVLFGALWCSRGSGCFLGLSGALWVLSSLSGPMCGCQPRERSELATKQKHYRFDRKGTQKGTPRQISGALWCSRGSGCSLGLSGALWVLSSLSGPMCGCQPSERSELATKQKHYRFDRHDSRFSQRSNLSRFPFYDSQVFSCVRFSFLFHVQK